MASIFLIMLIISTSLTNIFTILKMMHLHNLDNKYNQIYRSMKLAEARDYTSILQLLAQVLLQTLNHINNSIKISVPLYLGS